MSQKVKDRYTKTSIGLSNTSNVLNAVSGFEFNTKTFKTLKFAMEGGTYPIQIASDLVNVIGDFTKYRDVSKNRTILDLFGLGLDVAFGAGAIARSFLRVPQFNTLVIKGNEIRNIYDSLDKKITGPEETKAILRKGLRDVKFRTNQLSGFKSRLLFTDKQLSNYKSELLNKSFELYLLGNVRSEHFDVTSSSPMLSQGSQLKSLTERAQEAAEIGSKSAYSSPLKEGEEYFSPPLTKGSPYRFTEEGEGLQMTPSPPRESEERGGGVSLRRPSLEVKPTPLEIPPPLFDPNAPIFDPMDNSGVYHGLGSDPSDLPNSLRGYRFTGRNPIDPAEALKIYKILQDLEEEHVLIRGINNLRSKLALLLNVGKTFT